MTDSYKIIEHTQSTGVWTWWLEIKGEAEMRRFKIRVYQGHADAHRYNLAGHPLAYEDFVFQHMAEFPAKSYQAAFEKMVTVILWRMGIPAEPKTALERVADGVDI